MHQASQLILYTNRPVYDTYLFSQVEQAWREAHKKKPPPKEGDEEEEDEEGEEDEEEEEDEDD